MYGGYYGPQFGGLLMPRFVGAVKTIIIACIGVFVLQGLTCNVSSSPLGPIGELFALWPEKVLGRLHVWQLFSYMWLHGGVRHILWNMFALWMFGGAVQARLGRRGFWRLYIVCGLVGGVCAWLVSLLMGSTIPIVGASGAILGVIAAFVIMYPDARLLFMLFFPIRARTAALVIAGIQVLHIISATETVAGVGHLGGMGAGYLMLKGEDRLRYLGAWWRGRRLPTFSGWSNRRRLERDAALEQELDRVLDKIHREGISSLSSREKEVLRRASDRGAG